MQYLVNGLGPHSPIVRCVHHPLSLVGRNQFTFIRLSLFLAGLLRFRMDVVWKADVAHRGEHLLLVWRKFRLVVHHLVNFARDGAFQH